MQWKQCVESAEQDFANIADEDICRVRYEELTARPATVIQQITSFLDVDVPEETIEKASSPITPNAQQEKGQRIFGSAKGAKGARRKNYFFLAGRKEDCRPKGFALAIVDEAMSHSARLVFLSAGRKNQFYLTFAVLGVLRG